MSHLAIGGEGLAALDVDTLESWMGERPEQPRSQREVISGLAT